jgi:hypothetical protein
MPPFPYVFSERSGVMSWLTFYPLSTTSLSLLLLLMISTLIMRLHRTRRDQKLRHQPMALDLATAPARVRQNLRRM